MLVDRVRVAGPGVHVTSVVAGICAWKSHRRINRSATGRWAADERPQMASRDLAYLRKRKLDMDSAFDAAHSPEDTMPPHKSSPQDTPRS